MNNFLYFLQRRFSKMQSADNQAIQSLGDLFQTVSSMIEMLMPVITDSFSIIRFLLAALKTLMSIQRAAFGQSSLRQAISFRVIQVSQTNQTKYQLRKVYAEKLYPIFEDHYELILENSSNDYIVSNFFFLMLIKMFFRISSRAIISYLCCVQELRQILRRKFKLEIVYKKNL